MIGYGCIILAVTCIHKVEIHSDTMNNLYIPTCIHYSCIIFIIMKYSTNLSTVSYHTGISYIVSTTVNSSI